MIERKQFNPDFGTQSSTSIIKVMGVGGGGGNAVKHMYKEGIQGVDFLISNTDRLALDQNPVPHKLVLGDSGLGAGANPEVARQLASETTNEIKEFIGENTKLLFLTAGMGKGTGTGATPVIAKIAREMGILTIAVVTEPFLFEGAIATQQALAGIAELKKNVDSLVVIKNQNIMKYYIDAEFDKAFGYADDVLKNAVQCIAELITVNLDQNIDFNDIKSIMENSGPAMLGIAEAEGEDRVRKVVEGALNSPLLSEDNITNAKNFLFSLSYGPDVPFTISEFEELTAQLSSLRSDDAKIIWGRTRSKELGNKIKLAVIVTNFTTEETRTVTDIKTGSVSHSNDDGDKTWVSIDGSSKSDYLTSPQVEENQNMDYYGQPKITTDPSIMSDSPNPAAATPKPRNNPLSFLDSPSKPAEQPNHPESEQNPNLEYTGSDIRTERANIIKSQETLKSEHPYTQHGISEQSSFDASMRSSVLVDTYSDDDKFRKLVSTPAIYQLEKSQNMQSEEQSSSLDQSYFENNDDLAAFLNQTPD